MTRMLIAGGLLLNGGTEEQKERWLPGIASGAVLPAAAFTEPNAGSDTAGMQFRAVRQGDSYILNGPKTWITFANRANLMTVLARTDPDASKRHKGLSMILVEKTPGNDFMPPHLTGAPIPTIGYYGMKSFSLNFEDFVVPAENVIGGVEGRGFYQLMGVYETARIQTATRAVGVAQGAYEAALQYAQERQQFGRPIAEFQVIQHKIAHMATDIEAGRQLDLLRRADEGLWQALRSGGRHGQAVLRRHGGEGDQRGLADLRRLRLRHGVPGAPLLARRPRLQDFRRHQRDPGRGGGQAVDTRAEIE